MAITIGFGDLQNQGQQDPNQLGQTQNNAQNQSFNQPGVTTNVQQAGSDGSSVQQAGGQPGDQYKPDAYSKQKQGSGFTNVQRIIGANQPNQLAQSVSNNVQQAGQDANNNLQQANQQFQQQTQANTASNTDQNNQVAQSVFSDPTAYANQLGQNSTQGQQAARFNQLINGQYNGPTSLNNSNQLSAQAQALAQMGQSLNTPGGQTAVLQNMVGNSNYQPGEQQLDSLILGQAPQGSLNDARRQALNFQNVYNQSASGAQQQATEQQNIAQAYAKNLQNQLGQNVTTQDQNIQGQVTAAQAKQDAAYKKMLTDLQSGNITQDEAKLFGLTQGQEVTGQTLQNASNYLTENPNKATEQNVISSDDFARLQALQQLSGTAIPTDAQSVFQKFQDPKQAGTFANQQAATADTTRLGQDITSQDQAYHSVYDPAQQKLTAATNINNLVAQRDAASKQFNDFMAQNGQNLTDPAVQQQMQTLQQAMATPQQQIAQQYSGAVTNGTTRTDWANTNLTQAQQAYQNMLQQVAQYGGLKNINVIPSDMEQTPTVT